MADDLEQTGGAEPSLTEALEANFDAIAAREAPAAGEPAADIFADDVLSPVKGLRQDTPEPMAPVAEKAAEPTLTDTLEKALDKAAPDPEWLAETLAPIHGLMAEHKLAPRDVIGRLIEVDQQIRRDPMGAAVEVLRAHAGELSPEQASAIGAHVAKMLGAGDPNDLATIASQAAHKMMAGVHQHDRQSRARGTVETFAATRDETGAARYPHFEAVRPTMQGLLLAAAYRGENLTLEDAYTRAVWASPELREAMSGTQRPAPQKQQFSADGDDLGRTLNAAFDRMAAQ